MCECVSERVCVSRVSAQRHRLRNHPHRLATWAGTLFAQCRHSTTSSQATRLGIRYYPYTHPLPTNDRTDGQTGFWPLTRFPICPCAPSVRHLPVPRADPSRPLPCSPRHRHLPQEASVADALKYRKLGELVSLWSSNSGFHCRAYPVRVRAGEANPKETSGKTRSGKESLVARRAWPGARIS